jgi:hypothetical protein
MNRAGSCRGSTSYIEQGAEDRRSITKVTPAGVHRPRPYRTLKDPLF